MDQPNYATTRSEYLNCGSCRNLTHREHLCYYCGRPPLFEPLTTGTALPAHRGESSPVEGIVAGKRGEG